MRTGGVVFSISFCLIVGCNAGFAQLAYNTRIPQMQSARVNLSVLPDASAAVPAHTRPQPASHNSILQPLAPAPPANVKTQLQPARLAPAAASSFNALATPSPSAGFQAQKMVFNVPPYPTGAVSANYVMSASSDQVVIQDRSGTVLKQVLLDDFWSTFGSDIDPAWDPNVRYDPFADRFILVDMGAYSYAGSSLLVAVSATGDPTGTWYLRRILADSGTTFDFPCVGFNNTWMVVTGIEVEDPAPNNYLYSVAYTFDIADLYAGGSKAPVEFNNITNDFVLYPALTYDPNVSTMYLLSDYNGSNGSLSLSTITGSVDNPVLSLNIAYPSTSDTWASTPPERDFAPQLGSTTNIDVFDARLGTVVYRNGSLWTAHMVYLPASAPTVSAVDWWQVAPNGTVQQFGRLQDPNGQVFYTYPSLAVNSNGDMLMGYSRMSPQTYASGAYAFRAADDPPGTLRQEYVMPAGQGGGEDSYVILDASSINRWGEYSATQVDPVNDRDFWTVQEYAGPHDQSGDSSWGMWWANVTDPPIPLPALQSVSLNPSSVPGGQSSTGTVALSSAAPSGGVTVSVSSDNPAAQPPSSVLVEGGHTTATFIITTSAVGSSTLTSISASYNGGSVTAQLTIAPPSPNSVSLNPSSVVGGQSSTGMVTLNVAAPSGGLRVALSSDNAAAQLPASVLVQGGATSANFTITTSTVSASTPATISATYNGATATARLTVGPIPLVLTPSTTTVSLRPGSTTTLSLNLVSTTYAGTVSFTVASSSPDMTASAPPLVLTAGQSASSTLTITASRNAANHRPALPGKTGVVIAFAVVLGSPFSSRRKPLVALLILASAIAVAGFASSCATDPVRSPAARSYLVTVTPSASPVTTPALAPVQVNVSVQ